MGNRWRFKLELVDNWMRRQSLLKEENDGSGK
jgi:hypothetical protein